MSGSFSSHQSKTDYKNTINAAEYLKDLPEFEAALDFDAERFLDGFSVAGGNG